MRGPVGIVGLLIFNSQNPFKNNLVEASIGIRGIKIEFHYNGIQMIHPIKAISVDNLRKAEDTLQWIVAPVNSSTNRFCYELWNGGVDLE